MARKPEKVLPVELDPPVDALESNSAVEVMRAWIADGRLHVTFNADAFSHDVTEWGRMLADITHHLARSTSIGGQLTETEARDSIAEAYDRGVAGASTVAVGGIPGRLKH